jgi:hypothetical protein
MPTETRTRLAAAPPPCAWQWRGKQPSTVLPGSPDPGSGAYHWAEQGWSFIMLHRNPYQVFGYVDKGGQGYEVQSSMDNGWLARELQSATQAVSAAGVGGATADTACPPGPAAP